MEQDNEYLSGMEAIGSFCGKPEGPWEAREKWDIWETGFALALEPCVFTALRMFCGSYSGIKRPETGGQVG